MTAWQDIVALLVVAAAALYLARQAWLVISRRRSGGCGTCSNCPADKPSEPDVVSPEALRETGRGL